LNRGEGGVLYPPAAYFMKHPPAQFSDDEAYLMTQEFISGSWKPNANEMPYYSRRESEKVMSEK